MDGLIYNQKQIPREQWRYGFRTSAATGCGWIATYNALTLMGYRVSPEALIHYYEWQLPFVHGNAGTLALAPAVFFQKHGFSVETSSCRERFDELARTCPVCLLFYYWRKKHRLGAHFVALRYQDGRFVGYNTYSNSTGPDDYGPSLEEYLKNRKYFAPVLICIQDKRKKEKPGC